LDMGGPLEDVAYYAPDPEISNCGEESLSSRLQLLPDSSTHSAVSVCYNSMNLLSCTSNNEGYPAEVAAFRITNV